MKPLDSSQPTTVIQIRLANGGRIRETLNFSHTVRDLHAVLGREGATAQPYILMAGYPPKTIVNMDQTLQEAGLLGAAITQKWA
jgi:UBX domain-containing protein 1